MDELLYENAWGHLGCNDNQDNYVYPSNYIYDGRYILCHAQPGFKIDVMRQNTRVCFQVDDVKSHTKWKSVMVHGEYEEVMDKKERADLLKAFIDRQMLLKVTGNERDNDSTAAKASQVIYRIAVDKKTGLYEVD